MRPNLAATFRPFLILVAFLTSTQTLCKSIKGFQAARFGMTYSEVKEQFPKLGEITSKQGYSQAELANIRLVGNEAVLLFRFTKKKLYEVAAVFGLEGIASDAELREYMRIKALLRNGYGDPSESSEPRKRLGRTDFTDSALRTGDLMWSSVWRDVSTGNEITLQVRGVKLQAYVSIFYQDPKLGNQVKRAVASAQSDEL